MKADGKKLPFEESHISKNGFMRVFSSDVKDSELTWHRDDEDRQIQVISNTGEKKWLLQLDNQLPISLCEGSIYEIKRGQWHRVIAGDLNLKILVIKKEG